MRTLPLNDVLQGDYDGPCVYEILDGSPVYVGSTTKGASWRLRRHRRAGKDWPVAAWMRRLTTSGLTRASVVLRDPEEIGPGLTLRQAEAALQRLEHPSLCVVWVTSAAAPPLFEVPSVTEFDENYGITPEGKRKHEG